MAGFFKKLFNRITGKPEEAVRPAALAAPEVIPDAETAVPEVTVAPEIPASPPARPEKDAVEKPAPKKAVPKKALAKSRSQLKSKTSNQPAKPAAKAVAPKSKQKKPSAKAKPIRKPPRPVELVPKATPKPAPIPAQIVEPTPIVEIITTVPALEFVQPIPVTLIQVTQRSAPAPQPLLPPTPAPQQRSGWFSRLRDGLSKSSKSIAGNITSIFTKKKLDKATLQELEDTLIQADLGLPVAERIVAAVSQGRFDKEIDPEEVKRILAAEVAKVLKPVEVPFNFGSEKPYVIAVVGVNGSGKTTTIGKLGSIAAGEGFKIMFAAGDTFRAAAIEQLTIWGKRIGAETISRPTGADAAGLAFDALKLAQANGTDILFIDTAGRLQNKAYLMDELDKMVRVIKKLDPSAPHAVLLVLDATTGQNALSQAEIFTKVAGVTGLIMTKLDGTARGGILVAIAEKFKLPIHAIGVGEGIEDLQPFDADGFARAIAGLEEK